MMPIYQKFMHSGIFWYNVFSAPDKFLKDVIVVWHPISDVNQYLLFNYHMSIYTKKEEAEASSKLVM
tara:strand:+ start:302 stop:502 length:201 start_codon:yes stop_codon:yes gene_type:complete